MTNKPIRDESRCAPQPTGYVRENSLQSQRLDAWRRDPSQPFINQFVCAQPNERNSYLNTGNRRSEIAKTLAFYDRAFGSQNSEQRQGRNG
ncbi:hypothetical protein CHU98_g6970 [Xylaria longipes]|nr:hypothetical protein CHU98_g6970 [Xylaria longipes]